jgi:hypothetical protein
MINVLNVLLQKDRFCPRFYVAAATDNMSLQKAYLLEENVFNLVGSSNYSLFNFSHFGFLGIKCGTYVELNSLLYT